MVNDPWISSNYIFANSWYLERDQTIYRVLVGHLRPEQRSDPKQGLIFKQHRAIINDEERVVYAHLHYLPPGDGTARIITALVTATSMQLIIQTESGNTYRFDVLKETLDAITPAELTATPTGNSQTQPEATPAPLPSSEPTPLAGGAGGWMIEHPWFQARDNLANAWLMHTEQYTYTFYAGYEYVQNWQSQPKQGVIILKTTTVQDGREAVRSTEVHHLPRDSGAARIASVTGNGTDYQIIIATESGRTYRLDNQSDLPQEVRP